MSVDEAVAVTLPETVALDAGLVIATEGGVESVLEPIFILYVALSKKGPVEKLSSASTVNEVVVGVVGMPEITPVEEARESPGGKEPE